MATSEFYTKAKVDELLAEAGGIPSITIAMSQFSDETHFTLTEEQARTVISSDVVSITIQHHGLPGYESYKRYDGAYVRSDDNPYPSRVDRDEIALTRVVAKESIETGFFVSRINITATKLGDEYIYTAFSGEFAYGEVGSAKKSDIIERSETLPTPTADTADFVEVGGFIYAKTSIEWDEPALVGDTLTITQAYEAAQTGAELSIG